jgi:hypothetical protein
MPSGPMPLVFGGKGFPSGCIFVTGVTALLQHRNIRDRKVQLRNTILATYFKCGL